jgi:hypothetical protein
MISIPALPSAESHMELFNPAYAAPLVSLALLWTVAVVMPGPNSFNAAQVAGPIRRWLLCAVRGHAGSESLTAHGKKPYFQS